MAKNLTPCLQKLPFKDEPETPLERVIIIAARGAGEQESHGVDKEREIMDAVRGVAERHG